MVGARPPSSPEELFGFSNTSQLCDSPTPARVSYNSIRLSTRSGSAQTPQKLGPTRSPRFQEPLSSPRSPGSPVIYLSECRFGGSHDSNLGFNDSFKETHAQGAGGACAQGRASLRLQLGNDRAWSREGVGRARARSQAVGGRAGAQSSSPPRWRPARTAAPAVARRL